jgi:hypothetical protein
VNQDHHIVIPKSRNLELCSFSQSVYVTFKVIFFTRVVSNDIIAVVYISASFGGNLVIIFVMSRLISHHEDKHKESHSRLVLERRDADRNPSLVMALKFIDPTVSTVAVNQVSPRMKQQRETCVSSTLYFFIPAKSLSSSLSFFSCFSSQNHLPSCTCSGNTVSTD